MLNLDYNYTTIWNIPINKRTNIRYNWMLLHSNSFITTNTNFDIDYNEFYFNAQHTAQVLSIEHFLNEQLSPLVPIYITDGYWYPEWYLYTSTEPLSTPNYLFTDAEAETPTYLFDDNEYLNQQLDYQINIDISDTLLQDSINSYMNILKPAGKKYIIQVNS